MESFHNHSFRPIFDVFRDEEDGQRVAEFNEAWARQFVAEFELHCQWAREKGRQVPNEQYAFAKHVASLI
jgi:hypothetical protein